MNSVDFVPDKDFNINVVNSMKGQNSCNSDFLEACDNEGRKVFKALSVQAA